MLNQTNLQQLQQQYCQHAGGLSVVVGAPPRGLPHLPMLRGDGPLALPPALRQHTSQPQPQPQQQRPRRQQFHGSDEPKVPAAVNKGIICQQFFHRRKCEMPEGTCPYSHIADGDEHPIPERVCDDWCETECRADGCPHFHATEIQLHWLRESSQRRGLATYKPQDYMLVRQPLVPISWRMPAQAQQQQQQQQHHNSPPSPLSQQFSQPQSAASSQPQTPKVQPLLQLPPSPLLQLAQSRPLLLATPPAPPSPSLQPGSFTISVPTLLRGCGDDSSEYSYSHSTMAHSLSLDGADS